jgi:YVTN family beta-propeller protein
MGQGQFPTDQSGRQTLKVVQTWRFQHGIRPNVIAPDGHTFYTDLSYLNGLVKYDLNTGTIEKTVQMPFASGGVGLSPDSYPKNSAHHGIALSGDGSRLCDVGTIDDYTAIVNTNDLSTTGTITYPAGSLPYWGQTSADGRYCFVALSQLGQVSVIDYATATEVARVPVGAFPQRERTGTIDPKALAALSTATG